MSMTFPKTGERIACTAPYEATSRETANAARAPPNTSRGNEYMLTLKAETAKILSEMPAEAHAAVGASDTSAVVSASTEAARHT
jgi:hypothetical protein